MRFLVMIMLLNLLYVVPPVDAHPVCYKKKSNHHTRSFKKQHKRRHLCRFKPFQRRDYFFKHQRCDRQHLYKEDRWRFVYRNCKHEKYNGLCRK